MCNERETISSCGRDELCNCDKRKDEGKKEFLGKTVTECKYFRVCKCRFFEPEREKEDCCPGHCQRCRFCGQFHD